MSCTRDPSPAPGSATVRRTSTPRASKRGGPGPEPLGTGGRSIPGSDCPAPGCLGIVPDTVHLSARSPPRVPVPCPDLSPLAFTAQFPEVQCFTQPPRPLRSGTRQPDRGVLPLPPPGDFSKSSSASYNLGNWDSSSHTRKAKGLLRRICQHKGGYVSSSNIQSGTVGRK